MADAPEDRASSDEISELDEAVTDTPDTYDDDTTTGAIIENLKTSTVAEDYEDESVPDYVVNLVVNEQNEGDPQLTTKMLDVVITDMSGNLIPPKTTDMIDAIAEYTATIAGELSDETSTISGGGKGLWGWSTTKFIIFGLILLCIIAIIIAVLCLVLGKKFKKNKNTTQTAGASSSKQVGSKGASTDPKYQPVPNV